jgi:NAD(P)-dependent dehydrogenase (short-subunit alcohol dehydrogenase family)
MPSLQTDFSLTHKVALVVGASSGIGRHFSKVLAAAGANVVVTARRLERLESLVAEISAEEGRASAIEFDVTDRDGVTEMFDEAERAAGLIDVVVNCAGIANVGPVLELTDSDWDRTLEVNVNGLRRVSQEAARRLIAAERPGSIVNVASVAGAGVAPGYSAYGTSKAAVIQLTRSMATELWRHNIRVNALCPGYFLTEMNEDFFATERGRKYIKRTPPRRLGELDELSGPLLLLASEASSYMTGVALPVDGGHSIRLI